MRVFLSAAIVAAAAQSPEGDDRLYGHLPYPEAPREALVTVPARDASGAPCRVRATVLPDLVALIAAADLAVPGQHLRALSCFRSVAYQRAVFARSRQDAAARAQEVGPPGHSEHATGYAIDFAVRPWSGCRDVNACFADTAAGRWLLANGPAYGFELSFPAGNAQGVAWEPWHWRWAGRDQDEPGAADARLAFARARTDYPANPAAIGFAVRMIGQTDHDPPPGTSDRPWSLTVGEDGMTLVRRAVPSPTDRPTPQPTRGGGGV
jgi:zinc D-Ala-D-Ala carboxypeptidase